LNELSVFRTSLFLLTDFHLIFDTLICHTKIQIKFEFGFDPLIFPKFWPMDLEKYHELSVSGLLFSLLTDIHLIFGTLLCHTKIQIKFEFGFFQKLWPLDLKDITNYKFS
jgi:hypothetical protein